MKDQLRMITSPMIMLLVTASGTPPLILDVSVGRQWCYGWDCAASTHSRKLTEKKIHCIKGIFTVFTLLFAKDTIICLYLQKKKQYLHGNGCKPSPLQSIKQGRLNKTEMHFLSALPKPPITSAASDQIRGCSRMTSYLKSFDVTTFRVEKMSWSQLPQLMELLLHRELPKTCPGVV